MDRAYIDAAYFLSADSSLSFPPAVATFRRVVSKLQADSIACFSPGVGHSLNTGAGMLAQVLFQDAADFGLDPTDVLDLSRLLDRCQSYTSEFDAAYSINDAGAPTTSSAYSEAYRLATEQHLVGVIVAVNHAPGAYVITRNSSSGRSTYLLTDEACVPGFYRHHLTVKDFSRIMFERYGGRAFPKIIFASTVNPENLGVHLGTHAARIVGHLQFLNDYYLPIGHQSNWDLPTIQRMAKAHGIDLSDESSNTKQAPKKMRERRVSMKINGTDRTVSCTLHTKIEPTRGRIHFSVEAIGEQRAIVVGIMHEHLPT